MDLVAVLASAGLPRGTPASLAVVDRNGDIVSAASGSWPDGEPVAASDPFYAASLAKQVTGATTALLVLDGHLDADAPLASYVDGLPAWGDRLTSRQLLRHAGGLPGAGVIEAAIDRNWTSSAVLEYLRGLPTVVPGNQVYSNAGYVLLAAIIARASGKSFASFISDRFGLSFPADIGLFPQTPLLGARLPLSHGDGGLWVSAIDFVRWLHLQNRDEFGTEPLMTTAHVGSGDYDWGLGRRTHRGEAVFVHGGSWTGASARSARCPTLGVAAVAMVAGNEIDRVVKLVDTLLDGLVT